MGAPFHARVHDTVNIILEIQCSRQHWRDVDGVEALPVILICYAVINKMETNLPNNNNYEIKVKHTNSKYCRFCIRHEIPKLIQDNYLPGKVPEKINTHSYFGFVHYAQNYIISEYESISCIRNCYICND